MIDIKDVKSRPATAAGLNNQMSIKNHLKTRLKHFLLKQKIHLSTVTDEHKLVGFFQSVKAIKTEHELIRVGGESDGGYLIPNDIDGIDACFSPGVSTVANFENDLTKNGIRCFLADYSVQAPPIENPLFDFEKKYLGAANTDPFMTLENWISRKAPNKNNLLLQMDIEGSEYPVIFETSSETFSRFRILVIEFHGLEALFNAMGYELINLTFSKLLRNFEVVHIHPNNSMRPVMLNEISIPPIMEFTFLRKDRITKRTKYGSFPHALDRANVISNPDFALPNCWY